MPRAAAALLFVLAPCGADDSPASNVVPVAAVEEAAEVCGDGVDEGGVDEAGAGYACALPR